MADAGTILSIVQISLQIVAYIKAVREVPPELERLRREVTLASGIFENLRLQWQTADGDPWFESLDQVFKPDGLESAYKDALLELHATLDIGRDEADPEPRPQSAPRWTKKLRDKTGRWLQTARFPFKKDEIKSLLDRLSRFKQDVGHVQSQVQSRMLEDLGETLLSRLDRVESDTAASRKWSSDKDFQDALIWLSDSDDTTKVGVALQSCKDSEPTRFTADPTYVSWLSGKRGEDQVLWANGYPGAGKTVVMAYTCATLSTGTSDSAVAHFFCDYRGEQTSVMILRSLMRQFFEQLHVHPQTLHEVLCALDFDLSRTEEDDSRKELDILDGTPRLDRLGPRKFFEELLHRVKPATVIQRLIVGDGPSFVLIDALDELVEDERDQLVAELRKLVHQIPTLRLLISSRDTLEHYFNEARFFQRALCIRVFAHDDDLKSYVRRQVAERASSSMRALSKTSEELRRQIEDGIVSKSAGLFLLAERHVTDLASCTKLSVLRARLEALSTDLGKTAESTVDRIKSQEKAIAELGLGTLMWAVCAKRPLHVRELQHALLTTAHCSIEDFGNDNLDSEALIQSSTQGLVRIDHYTRLVNIHKSVSDVFLKNNGKKLEEVFGDAEAKITAACLRYLSLPWLQFIWADSRHAAHAQQEYGKSWPDSVREWTHNERFEVFQAGVLANEAYAGPLVRSAATFAAYAAENWGWHAQSVEPDTVARQLASLFKDPSARLVASILLAHNCVNPDPGITRDRWLMRQCGLEFQSLAINETTRLHLATYFGLTKVIRSMIERDKINLNCPAYRGLTALHIASFMAQSEAASLLLDHGANPKIPVWIGVTCLHLAAVAGGSRTKTVKALLQREPALLNVQNTFGNTPLIDASERGHTKVVKTLLRAGADAAIYKHDPNMNPDTALHMAARNGHFSVVDALVTESTAGKRLLELKTRAWGDTPLSICASLGKLRMVKKLLEHGADINAVQNQGWTPLCLALTHRRLDVARFLVEKGAALGPTSADGSTPLHVAVRSFMPSAVRWILEEDDGPAVVDARSTLRGETALFQAVQLVRPRATRALLKHGADPDVADIDGRTARRLLQESGCPAAYRVFDRDAAKQYQPLFRAVPPPKLPDAAASKTTADDQSTA